MISQQSERTPSLRDLLKSASSRLGIKQLAGGIGLLQPWKKVRIARVQNLAELFLISLPKTICILPLPDFPHKKGAPFSFTMLSSLFTGGSQPESACIALAGTDQIPELLIQVTKNSETTIFSSLYDEYHLESRLIGLLREQTEEETSLSGGLIQFEGMGIFITGESGVGKTTCAYELVKEGGRWVADDVVVVKKKSDGLLYGRSWNFKFPLLEIKERGIVRADEVIEPSSILSETRMDFFIELVDEKSRSMGTERDHPLKILNIIGTHLPGISLSVSEDASSTAAKMKICSKNLRRLRENL